MEGDPTRRPMAIQHWWLLRHGIHKEGNPTFDYANLRLQCPEVLMRPFAICEAAYGNGKEGEAALSQTSST